MFKNITQHVFISAILVLSSSYAVAAMFQLDPAQTTINWKGSKKVTGSSHIGTIKLKSGFVEISNNTPTKASIIVDMTSIKNSDVKKKEWNKKLVGHLESDDFFNVTKFQESKLEVNDCKSSEKGKYTCEGKLTIRGITKPTTIQLTDVKIEKNMASAKGTLVFNRLDFGITYNSEKSFIEKTISIPKDKIIANDIELDFIVASKK